MASEAPATPTTLLVAARMSSRVAPPSSSASAFCGSLPKMMSTFWNSTVVGPEDFGPEDLASPAMAQRPFCLASRCLQRRSSRSEEHTSEIQSLMRISYAVFCLKKKHTVTTSTKAHYAHTILLSHNKSV